MPNICLHESNQIMFYPICLCDKLTVFKLWVCWVTFNNFSPDLFIIICGMWWGLTASISGCIETQSYGSIIAAFKPAFTCSLFKRSCTTLPDHSWEALIIMRAINENWLQI